MWFKHRAWIPIAWVLSLVNLGAVWFAAAAGPSEPTHATVHALLAVLFGVGAQRLMSRRAASGAGAALVDDHAKRLEQAIDAIAIEVERVGEGQRFVTKLLAERGLEIDRSQSRQPGSVAPRDPPK